MSATDFTSANPTVDSRVFRWLSARSKVKKEWCTYPGKSPRPGLFFRGSVRLSPFVEDFHENRRAAETDQNPVDHAGVKGRPEKSGPAMWSRRWFPSSEADR